MDFMKLKYRMWIENEAGEPVMGEGLRAILLAIAGTGSLRQAADQLNMSYKHAWTKIRKSEKRLGYMIVRKQVGGVEGGGTSLTPEGQRLLDTYARFRGEASREVERLFREHFPKE
jgi:molybdate transport system regulatory protein